MKAAWLIALTTAAVAAFAAPNSMNVGRTPTPTASSGERVGVYDSRALAFAHFWSEPEQKRRNQAVAEAKAARESGDQVEAQSRSRALAAEQRRSHLQVFSTAPSPEALSALQNRLPELQRELGVVRFISKWDATALRDVPETNRIDVTDRLVREFNLPPPRQRTIDELKKKTPLPLEQATRLVEQGKL
jgi:hypothetical protein